VFVGVASFFIGGLLREPHCVFRGCLFFIGGLLSKPFAFLRLHLFSSEAF
jgi:hypothetical protein